MAARADVDSHLGRRGAAIDAALSEWCVPDLSDADRVNVVQSYLVQADLGDAGRVGGGTSVMAERCRAAPAAPTVLIVGTHDIGQLAKTESNPARPFDPTELRGPGLGSTFAPTVAFAEGFKATLTADQGDSVNIRILSIGPGESLTAALSAINTDDIDAVFFTNSVAWGPNHPTITIGARGRLEVQITITAGQLVNDATFAGAVRNPLNKLVELLGGLRDPQGKVAIPGFYRRANPPGGSDRAELTKDGFDPNEWIGGLDVRRPAGSVSALERATMWPAVSISDIDAPDTTGTSTPASATATLSIYLVPDQRPVEVEAALKSWVKQQVPANLAATVSVLSIARPYRSSPDQLAVAAQSRAASRIHGRAPLFVPGGGAIGAGEVQFATGASVGFAGICGPRNGFGSADEVVPRALFDLGISQAAETCLQLRRRTALRSTS